MIISGNDLLLGALELITGDSGLPGRSNDADLDMLARRSRSVLDSLNLDTGTAVGGAVEHGVLVPAGSDSFTWGPAGSGGAGGDVRAPGASLTDPNAQRAAPPTELRTWGYVDTAGERLVASNYALLDAERFAVAASDFNDPESDPFYIYWEKTLRGGGYTFRMAPAVNRAVEIFLYAFVPRITEIERGGSYELDNGFSTYLQYQLALDAAPVFGFQVSPDLNARALAAADRIGQFTREAEILEVSNPSFLIGEPWDRIRRGSGF